MIVIELIYNLAVLVALCTLSGFIDTKFDRSTTTGKILQGLLFSLVAIIGMMYPFKLSDGIIFDGRSIVISLATLFFGPVTGIIAAISAIIFRNYLGGGGALTGTLVITASFVIGYFYHQIILKKQYKISNLELYFFGLIVNSVMMLLMLTLPSNSIVQTYKLVTLTVVGIYPIITVIIGKILLDHYENKLSFINITKSESLFRTILYSIGDAVITTDTNAKIIHLNKVAEELTGWQESEVKGYDVNKVFHIINETNRQKAENPVFRVLENGLIVGLANHTLLISRNGIEIPIADSGAPIKNEKGEIVGVVLVFRDQTTEREQQRILELSEQNFREILNSTSEGIFIHNAYNGKIVDINDTAIKMYGFESKSEFLNYTIEEFSANSESYTLDDALNYIQLANSGQNVSFEWLAKKHNGDLFWTEVTLRKTEISGNDRVIAVVRDITERKQSEEYFEKSQEKLVSIFESMIEGINYNEVVLENDEIVDFNILEANMAFETITQLNRKLTIGRLASEVFSDHLKPLFREQLIALKTDKLSGFDFYDIIQRKHIHIASSKPKDGKFVITYDDITERIKTQNEIRDSEIMLNKAQKISKMGSWTWYVQEGKVKWSDEMYEIFGLNKNDDKVDLFEVIQSRIHPDDVETVNKSNESVMIDKKPIPVEYRLVLPDGKIKYVWGEAGELILGLDDNVEQLSGIVQDITEIKKAQQQLLKAKERAEESDRLKTAFLQNMSHEIRTPLNGMIGFTRLLNDDSITIEEAKEYAQFIESSGNRLLELINNIIDLSKIESGNILMNENTISISKLINEVYFQQSHIANDKHILLNRILPDSEYIINADSLKIHQVLSNLVSNAIKFTQIGSVEFGYNVIENEVIFFVKDTGIGISSEYHDKIFDRFYQVDSSLSRGFEGSGLGLSICKGLVDLLNGKIWLESELDYGSTFYFSIPYHETKAKSKTNTFVPSNNLKHKTNKKILIAEDDNISFKYLKRILDNEDITLYNVTNGLEAVNFCKKNFNIDLILMDLKMPIMNGLEATKIIKEFNPNIKIIAQTAYAFSTDMKDAKNAGCDEYLTKPIDKNTLLNCINKFL